MTEPLGASVDGKGICVFRLNPLPDFLADHTLTGEAEVSRISEHTSRWIQFVVGLWIWKERASFAIRYIGGGGTVECFLVAVPRGGMDLDTLSACLEASLLTERLIRATDDYKVAQSEFFRKSSVEEPCILDRAQLVAEELWTFPAQLRRDQGLLKMLGDTDVIPPEPPVVFPWQGPGGSFIPPMELLSIQKEKAVITTYLAPVEMPVEELKLLSALASSAQTEGKLMDGAIGRAGGGHRINVAASMAGDIYTSHLKRLWPNSFFTLVQVTVGGRRFDLARSLIASLSACVMEPIGQLGSDHANFPVGLSACLDIEDSGVQEENQILYDCLDLRNCCPPEIDVRMQLLTDARGGATLFRFPVSVRGGVPGIEVRQFPPDYHVGPIQREAPANERVLMLGRYSSGGAAYIPVDHLTRHALIVGFTGSGKTVTSLRILHQLLASYQVPWLVLESAKQEYRGLTTVRRIKESGHKIRVYTLGNSACVPFRLNPFELIEGVRVEAHISRLQVCFEAAIPSVGPSSSIIFEALCLVYERHGWTLGDICSPQIREDGRLFPTLNSFVETVSLVIESRGYSGEVLSNVEAAVVGRFKPLLLGGKGQMFDAQCSDPPLDVLFEEPTVLEMNDLNLDDKALTVMFLLTMLREFREVNKTAKKGLKHVTMVEEAHNILEEVGSQAGSESSADTRSKAVASFCSMLAEIRSLGEGIIIADQSPQKLARDAIRNTNLQISHQLRDGSDRDTMATAMIMDNDQVDFLGKLEVGHASVFWTGREKAGFLKVDPYTGHESFLGDGFAEDLEDEDLKAYMFDAFGAETLDEWNEWYALISPESRRERGLTLEKYWDWGVSLASNNKNNGTVLNAERSWLRFSQNWFRLTRQAGAPSKSSQLTSAHRNHFDAAYLRMNKAE